MRNLVCPLFVIFVTVVFTGCEKPPVCTKSCNTPPVAQCNEDDDTYLTYAPAGTCGADNECHYDLVSTPCPQCAINCLGLCKDVECPLTDKSNSCKINGFCTIKDNNPVCSFQNAPNGTACAQGVCFEGSCVECYNDRQCNVPESGIVDCWQATCENGSCKYEQPATPLICRASSCREGYETAAVSCLADGSCPAASAPRFCDGLACDGDYCRTSCQDKSHCLSGYDCNTDSHICQEELLPVISDDCHSDIDCAASKNGRFCQESTGNCVQGGPGAPCDDDFDCKWTVNIDETITHNHHCRESIGQCVSGGSGKGQEGDADYEAPSTCDDDGDCDDGNHCQLSKGICVSGASGKNGEPVSTCDDEGDCDSGFCRISVGLCVTGDTDAPCDRDDECRDSRLCRQSTKSCVKPGQNSPCDDDDDCYNGSTVRYCQASVHRCVDGQHNDKDALENQCIAGTGRCDCDDDGDCKSKLNSDNTIKQENHCQASRGLCVSGGLESTCDDDGDCDNGHHCLASRGLCVSGDVGAECDDDGDCDKGKTCYLFDVSDGHSDQFLDHTCQKIISAE